MAQKRSKRPLRYELLVEPDVHTARTDLPGNVRQRAKRAIGELAVVPRPPHSDLLDVTGLGVPDNMELRRLRLATWRVVYAVSDEEGWVWVLAIHRRPPYDYQDLQELAARLR